MTDSSSLAVTCGGGSSYEQIAGSGGPGRGAGRPVARSGLAGVAAPGRNFGNAQGSGWGERESGSVDEMPGPWFGSESGAYDGVEAVNGEVGVLQAVAT
jgi:hypothetical protein